MLVCRSLGKSGSLDVNQNQQNITRSSTYEKLPINDEEAGKISLLEQAEKNNNDCHCLGDSADPKNKFNHSCSFESFSKQQQANKTCFANDSLNGNFTFTTFVKTDKKIITTTTPPAVEDSSGISSASSTSTQPSRQRKCLVTTV